MALSTNLQAYWKFDESSGNAADSSGNSNTLTNAGGATFASAKINNGANLNAGSTSYFTLANGSSTGINFTGSFTMAGWVNFNNNPANGVHYVLCFKQNDGVDAQYSYQVSANSAGTYQMILTVKPGGSLQNATVNWPTAPTTGTWYHCAAVYDATANTVQFYLNGAIFGDPQPVSSGALTTTTNPFSVGARLVTGSYTDFADMKVDEVGMWSRALTVGEINQLYNNGIGQAYPFAGTTGITLDNYKTFQVASGSISQSFTVTGPNNVLVVILNDVNNNASGSITVTYNGTTVPFVGSQQATGGATFSAFVLANPATGSNTLSVTRSSSGTNAYAGVWSLNAAAQTGQPQTTTLGSGTSVTSQTLTATNSVANSWMVGAVRNNNGTVNSAGSNTYMRDTISNMGACDSNGLLATGSSSLVVNTTASANMGGVAVIISAISSATGNSNFFTFLPM